MGAPSSSVRFGVSFELTEAPSSWRLEEDDVPETPLHDQIIELLVAILRQGLRREGRAGFVARNLGCRWDPRDGRVGTDPDIVLLDLEPADGERLTTLRVWEEGHPPPRVAVEVVSDHAPEKDYLEAPLRCARLGARELWVFDPERFGPEVTGGPFPLQIWRLDDDAPRMRRTYAGDGPGYSEALGAWLVVTEAPRRLRVAAGPQGPLWPSEAEAEAARADAEARRADAEAARAEAEARRAEAEAQRAEAEARRAEDAEDELARLRRRLDAED